MLNLAQLLRVPCVDSKFAISPDGLKLAFAWNKTGERQIYEMELGNLSSQQITFGVGGKFNPHYSPDGSCLAYVLDMDGSENYHLVIFDPATNTHTDLTPNISHALQPNFCWSPDGSQLAFLGDEQGHFSTYIMPSTGGNAQLILYTGHPAWQVEWSSDGRHLAVCCEMYGQDYGIFIVDTENKEVTKIDFNANHPKWSPDGMKLAFHGDVDGWFYPYAYDIKEDGYDLLNKREGGDSQSLAIRETKTSLIELNAQNLARKTHALRVAYTESNGPFNWIEILDIDVHKKIYQLGKGIHDGIKLTSDVKRIVCSFSSPSQPPDLWMIDVDSGESIQMTKSMPKQLSNEEFILPDEIVYQGMDGVEVPALLFRPKKIPAPAVVMIHGGPNWHYSAEWDPVMTYLVSRGCVVLAPNYRGSTGYGRDWQYAARFDLGGVDTRDVAAGAQYLIREGLADPKRIAVTGRSHGGYLTMTCLTQYPELWCTGSAVVPFMNWFNAHKNSREDVKHWDIENMGNPKENYERWYNASPYFFLDQINAPVQLICGGNDPRCPASESIDTRDKLVELGKEVELLLYEDEGHAFLKLENILDAELKRAEFLAKVLERNK